VKVITLARAPLRGAVAQSCIEWSTGAINIDGTRIAGPTWTRSTESLEDIRGGRYGSASKDRIPVPPQAMPSGGRWPSNMVLQHKPSCRQTGTTTAPGYMINRWTDGAKPFGGGAGHPYEGEKQPDESVTVWECEEGCGVAGVDQQGGLLTSGKPVGARHTGGTLLAGGGNEYMLTGYGDTGTASRFFKQVQETDMHELPQELIDYLETMITPPEGEVLIVSDMSAVNWSEYEDNQLHGLLIVGKRADEFSGNDYMEQIWRVLRPGAHVMLIASDEEPTGHTGACALEDKGFEIRDSILLVQEPGRIHYVAKAATKERNAGIVPFERKVKEKRLFPKPEHMDDIELEFAEVKTEEEIAAWVEEGASRMEIPKDHRQWFDEREVEIVKKKQNDHPTIKAKDLLRRLLGDLPEGSLVVDPFMGSGSTGIACVEAGMAFTGIELEMESLQIADARVRHWDSAELRPWAAEVVSEAEQPKRKKRSFLQLREK